MVKKLPLVSVVVPAFNEEDYIADCLESLTKQDLPRENYEVIVVDNASTDATGKIAKSFGAKVVKEPKKGVVFALIRGVSVARGEFLAFTDADCIIPENWLSATLDTFNKNPEVAGASFPITLYDAGGLLLKTHSLIEKRINILCGGGMAIRKDTLSKSGGLEPTINLAWDYYLTRKIRKIGKINKVRDLTIKTSARRYYSGKLSIISYGINILTIILLNKTYIFSFPDIRKKFQLVASDIRNNIKDKAYAKLNPVFIRKK